VQMKKNNRNLDLLKIGNIMRKTLERKEPFHSAASKSNGMICVLLPCPGDDTHNFFIARKKELLNIHSVHLHTK